MKLNKLLIGLLIVFIATVLFLTLKISGKPNTKQADTSAISNNIPIPTKVDVGSSAPDFTLTTLDKETFRLSDKKGKTVILFGMAGWCGTCIPEGRALTQIRKEYASKGVEIIGVAFTKGDNDDFLEEFKRLGTINIPLALDTDNVGGKYNLTRLETTYIINKDGAVVYKDEQSTSYEDYKKELDKII